MKKEIKKIIMGIVLVCGLSLFVWGKVSRYMKDHPKSDMLQPTSTINQAPSNGSGILVITKHAWRGVAVPPHMTIKVWSITTNVVRRVQVNEDPNRETPVYPDSKNIVLGNDLRYVAWKIQDDQLVSEAKIGYQFIPL